MITPIPTSLELNDTLVPKLDSDSTTPILALRISMTVTGADTRVGGFFVEINNTRLEYKKDFFLKTTGLSDSDYTFEDIESVANGGTPDIPISNNSGTRYPKINIVFTKPIYKIDNISFYGQPGRNAKIRFYFYDNINFSGEIFSTTNSTLNGYYNVVITFPEIPNIAVAHDITSIGNTEVVTSNNSFNTKELQGHDKLKASGITELVTFETHGTNIGNILELTLQPGQVYGITSNSSGIQDFVDKNIYHTLLEIGFRCRRNFPGNIGEHAILFVEAIWGNEVIAHTTIEVPSNTELQLAKGKFNIPIEFHQIAALNIRITPKANADVFMERTASITLNGNTYANIYVTDFLVSTAYISVGKDLEDLNNSLIKIKNEVAESTKFLNIIHEELTSHSSNQANLYTGIGVTSDVQSIVIKNIHPTKGLLLASLSLTLTSKNGSADTYVKIEVAKNNDATTGATLTPILENKGGVDLVEVKDGITTTYAELPRVYGGKNTPEAISGIIGHVLDFNGTIWIKIERNHIDIEQYCWSLKIERDAT